MAQSRQAIQSRISSVESTKKITRAMQMVASSKLTKARNQLDKNRAYAAGMKELLSQVSAAAGRGNPYLKENEGKPAVIFVITSDMGLCGGYNANVYKELLSVAKPEDHIIMIGSRGCTWAKARDITPYTQLVDLNDDTAYMELSKAAEDALHLFQDGEVSRIQVLYTRYKNTLTFIPTLETLLPVTRAEVKSASSQQDTIFEPGREAMLGEIIPLALKSLLYSDYLESKTSEQASRRSAMESATENADELQEQLELAFNQARQSAITQEITEIVGGANALK